MWLAVVVRDCSSCRTPLSLGMKGKGWGGAVIVVLPFVCSNGMKHTIRSNGTVHKGVAKEGHGVGCCSHLRLVRCGLPATCKPKGRGAHRACM